MLSYARRLWSITSSTIVALLLLSFILSDISFKLSTLHDRRTTWTEPWKHWRDWRLSDPFHESQPVETWTNGTDEELAKSLQENPSEFVKWLQQCGITPGHHPIVTIGDSNYVEGLQNLRAGLDRYGHGESLVVLCLDDVCAQETTYHGWRVMLDPGVPVMKQVAEVKFTSGIDLLLHGYDFVFLDGDVYLTIYRDPFKEMLSPSNHTWDIQFQMDEFNGRALNIGWFFARACDRTKKLFHRSYAQWLETAAWDQAIMNEVAHDMEANLSLSIHRLDLDRFRNFMFYDQEEWIFGSEERVQSFIEDSAIIHYTCVERDLKGYFGANLGGFSDLNGYYSNPPPLLGATNIAGTSEAIFQQVAYALQLASKTGRTFIWPNSVSIIQTRSVDADTIRHFSHTQFPGIRAVSQTSARRAGLKVVEGRYLQNQQHIVKDSVRSTREIDVGMFLQHDPSNAEKLESVIREIPSHVTLILDFGAIRPQGRSWLRPEDFNVQIAYELDGGGFAEHLFEMSTAFEEMLQETGVLRYSESMMLQLRKCKNADWGQECLKLCDWE